MFRILNLLLDVFCIVGMAVCAIGLVVYVAAALAIVDAEKIARGIEHWLHGER